MIILKLLAIIFLTYMFARGMTIEDSKMRIQAENDLKDIRDAAKEAYQLMQAEKTILVDTIQELRLELESEKIKNEDILNFRRKG